MERRCVLDTSLSGLGCLTGHVAAVHKARADFYDPHCKADVQSSALIGRVHCVPGPLGTSEGRQGRQQTACDSGTKAVDP